MRERAGLMPGTDVAFGLGAGFVRLVQATPADGRLTRGQKLARSLRGHGDYRMTTDEIVALMRGTAADEGWSWPAVILVDTNVIIDILTEDPGYFPKIQLISPP